MVRGRKRHIVTDTLGLLLIVVVTAANADDGTTAPRLLAGLPAVTFPRLAVVWADNKYRNKALDAWLAGQDRLRVEVTSKPEGKVGFEPLPKRWVVEQTFGCLLRWRRLVRDFERLPETSAAMVKLSLDPSDGPPRPPAAVAEEVPLQAAGQGGRLTPLEQSLSSTSVLLHRYAAGARAENKVSRNARGSFDKASP